jgi:VWFA-related protein
MSLHSIRRLSRYFILLLWVLVAAASAQGQGAPGPQPSPTADDVVRVNTELVQTDVTVFDKAGRFVRGLKPEAFQLRVDQKPQSIAFFEELTSQSSRREIKTQKDASPEETKSSTPRSARTLLFFIDDLHLAPDSLVHTRKALLDFIDGGMGATDQVAITSASGQIGFLQQLTDDKVALRSAVARLTYRANSKIDMENPPMSEYMALKIREGDESTISYFVTEIMKQNCFRSGGEYICMMSTQSARLLVLERARQMVAESAPDTDNTLRLLERVMRIAAQLPGRKLMFLISDGFYSSDRKYGLQDKIKRITEAAGRAGVVIYTLDARGLVSEGVNATNNRPIESGGLLAGSGMGELAASQDGLNALARDTGGRAFRNTNRPVSEWVDDVLAETSNYYLLAWRPDSDEQKRRKFNHIEVTIKDRPDLNVRLRKGYFKTAPLPILTTKKKPDKDPTKAREDDMRLVIDAPLSQREVPTQLSLDYLQVPGVGTKVVASVEINREALTFDSVDGKKAAEIDIGGIFYDDKGKPKSSFVGRLRIYPTAENSTQEKAGAVYRFQAWLPGGLYQVRVGVRDVRNGKIGSAMQWVKIPSLN